MAVYVLLATLVAPALVQLGVTPLAAHLFVFYFGMLSMITPPLCLATYTAAGIGGANFWEAGWASMRLAATAYLVPFLFALDPALLGVGPAWRVVLAAVTAAAGAYLLAAALVGYWFGPMEAWERAVLVFCGVAILTPETGQSLAFSWLVEVVGLVAAVLLAVRNKRRATRRPALTLAEGLDPTVPAS